MDYLKLTPDKISVEKVTELVTDKSCGAISLFVGTTRDNFEGKTVLRLEYEAYESMALKAMKNICDEVRRQWPHVNGIAMYHRLGEVPCKEASVVIAVSSPHRQESLAAVAYCIDTLKSNVPIWKKEIYETEEGRSEDPVEQSPSADGIDKTLVQINVSNEELQKRINNFIERKREQVNINNVQDFIPSREEGEQTETSARVRTQFVRRSDSKGHLKVRKVHNEWGPQISQSIKSEPKIKDGGLPQGIAERVQSIEKFLNTAPVSKDIYKRLKDMEDKIAELQAVSPEYAQFWKRSRGRFDSEAKQDAMDYIFTADDINMKIEQLEKEANY